MPPSFFSAAGNDERQPNHAGQQLADRMHRNGDLRSTASCQAGSWRAARTHNQLEKPRSYLDGGFRRAQHDELGLHRAGLDAGLEPAYASG